LADPTDAEQRACAVREYSNNVALSFFEGAQAPVLKVDPRNGVDDNIFVNYPETVDTSKWFKLSHNHPLRQVG